MSEGFADDEEGRYWLALAARKKQESVIDPVLRTQMLKRESDALAAQATVPPPSQRYYSDLNESAMLIHIQDLWDAQVYASGKSEVELRAGGKKVRQEIRKIESIEAQQYSPVAIEKRKADALPKIEKHIKDRLKRGGVGVMLLDDRVITWEDLDKFVCEWPHNDGKPVKYSGDILVHQIAVGMKMTDYDEAHVDQELFSETTTRSLWCPKCLCARRVGGTWLNIVRKK